MSQTDAELAALEAQVRAWPALVQGLADLLALCP